jgi:SNF2 family DNA or RNA helicase
MDMGTGKTITTIAVAGALYLKHKVFHLLVVCPKSITQVWQQEFEKFADFHYSLAVLDGTGTKKSDTIRYMEGAGLQVIVVNYESAWRLESELAYWRPDMIVCDESSKIKNPQAKCSKALHHLGKISSYNFILTGTPITNSPLDFYSQYKFLDESIFGSSYYSFRNKYAIIGGFQNHQIVGYKHLDELVEKAHCIAFRIRIDEAVELPEFVEEIRPVQLEKQAQKIYDGIDKDSFAELMNGEVTTRNVLTRLLRLSQCTGGFIRNDDGDFIQQVSSAKLEALEDIIDSCIEEGKKVVVFARFVPEIEAIGNMLRKKGIKYSLIKGDVKDRAEQVDNFQNDADTKVFIGQLQTTGMGLTLTAGSVCVYYSVDFSYANYQQSMARIRRIGQTKRGVYIHLVAKDTIDEQVMAALKHKGDVAKILVDDYKKILGDQRNV